ncbi:RagB/SusD family nutrient uptake outer membrane protein [Sphingobacterium paucimobilis]|nr:RagB/SusD family nutrient uptake outer membrane protein [Sphingobacterium paucimobilis]
MKPLYVVASVFLLSIITGCDSFLDEKPDQKLSIPTTIEDLNAILSGTGTLKGVQESEVMTDDYYLLDADYDALFCMTDIELYSWKDPNFIQTCDGDSGWGYGYSTIYRANVVLEALEKYQAQYGVSQKSEEVKGRAYFLRAINHLEIAQAWGEVYVAEDADKKQGIPLKLNADFNEKTTRATLAETFGQIEDDFLKASQLLPVRAEKIHLPSRAAALSYMARMYLYMNDFPKAAEYADLTLKEGGSLLDYNEFTFSGRYPFTVDEHKEVLYGRALSGAHYSMNVGIRKVKQDLYDSYPINDLRKKIFFSENVDGTIRFIGSYSGASLFSGTTAAEMYLILAETHAREQNYDLSRSLLLSFLQHRLLKNTAIPNILDDNLLDEVIEQRRKELLFRGVRFTDVKRLNSLGAGIKMKRIIKGKEEILPSNDPRFNLLIPEQVVRMSGVKQNRR